MTPAQQLVHDLCAANPDLASRAIARMLRHNHPELFSSVELARTAVRYARGNLGGFNRDMARCKANFRPNGEAGTVVVPIGLKQGRKPIIIDGPCKALILNDLHVPYHDECAIQVAVEMGLREGCDCLYLNGDFIDFYAISRFQTDPRHRDLLGEVDTARQVLQSLSEHFERKWFKCGNHEDRWEHYLFAHAQDFVGFAEFELRSVLKLEEFGYEFVYSKQWAHLGKLHVLHGHEFVRGFAAPVNPARGLWLKLTDTALCAHWHQTSHHSDTHALTKNMVRRSVQRTIRCGGHRHGRRRNRRLGN